MTLSYPPPPLPPRTHWNRSRRKTSLDSVAKSPKWAITSDTKQVACVASVCFGFRSKQRPGSMIFGFGRARNGTRAIFSRSLWLSFLVLCSQTTRKRLLRRLRLFQTESFLICYQTSQFCLFVVLFLSGCPRGQRPIEKWVASMLKKGQNDGRSPQRVPSPLQWGRLFPFAGSGRVISGLLVDRFRSRFGTNTSLTYCVELLAQYLSNTVIR